MVSSSGVAGAEGALSDVEIAVVASSVVTATVAGAEGMASGAEAARGES